MTITVVPTSCLTPREEVQNEKQLYTVFPGRRRKKTTPWPNAGSACEHGVPRNRCSASMHLPMKTVILLKMRTSRARDCAPNGARFLSHAPRTSGTMPTRPFSNTFRKFRKIFSGKLTREFDEMIATKKEPAPGPDGIPHSIYRCAGGLGSHFLFNVYKRVLEGGVVPTHFAASRNVFIPKSSIVDDNELIVRPPDALHPLTLCNCDCNIITTAICFGLHRYSIRCTHPAQRCISSRQMTDNIFEVETTALAHVTCATCDSGILLTVFAAAYPSVSRFWIFHVLEKAEVPGLA